MKISREGDCQRIVMIGAGGFARDILDILDACNATGRKYELLGYIVETKYGKPGLMVDEKPILGDFNWFTENKEEVHAITAVGSPSVRLRLVKKAGKWHGRFCNVIAPSAVLTHNLALGEDVVIGAGSILAFQTHIGNHVHVNLACTIGHNAVLEDYVTLAPGVHVSGDVVLSRGCYIGTGANIIEKIRIGEWSIVGAGSTIVSDVPPNTTVVGVPGRVIKNHEIGWHLKNMEGT